MEDLYGQPPPRIGVMSKIKTLPKIRWVTGSYEFYRAGSIYPLHPPYKLTEYLIENSLSKAVSTNTIILSKQVFLIFPMITLLLENKKPKIRLIINQQ
jgi:hypothetical protein